MRKVANSCQRIWSSSLNGAGFEKNGKLIENKFRWVDDDPKSNIC